MKIVYDYPPNYKQIDKAYGIKDNPNIVFTYGNTLYIPIGKQPDLPLLRHEEVHAKQQTSMGIELWWSRHIAEPEFRLAQELEAYRAQYKAMFNLTARHRRSYLDSISADLAGPMYGNILSFDDAKKLITGINPGEPVRPTSPKSKRLERKKQRQNKRKARR